MKTRTALHLVMIAAAAAVFAAAAHSKWTGPENLETSGVAEAGALR